MEEILKNVNLPLLKAQKTVLIEMSMGGKLSKEEQKAIDGIINLLDAIQDELEPSEETTETIEFRGKQYPIRRVFLPRHDHEVIISTYELNVELSKNINQDSTDLDEQIFYYTDEEEFAKSDEELIEYLDNI